VSPVKYELGVYIPEDDILHSHRLENRKSYIALTGWTLERKRNVSPVKYELGFYIPEDDILHSHRRENVKFYTVNTEIDTLIHILSMQRTAGNGHQLAALNTSLNVCNCRSTYQKKS
jgi:hypothetical protein